MNGGQLTPVHIISIAMFKSTFTLEVCCTGVSEYIFLTCYSLPTYHNSNNAEITNE